MTSTLELMSLVLPREQLKVGSLRAGAHPGAREVEESAWRDLVGPPVSTAVKLGLGWVLEGPPVMRGECTIWSLVPLVVG